jgi:hypothetical protein
MTVNVQVALQDGLRLVPQVVSIAFDASGYPYRLGVARVRFIEESPR